MPVEGTYRAHQVPLSGVRENPEHLAMLEILAAQLSARGAASTPTAGSSTELAELAPNGDKRMGATPYANGGALTEPLATRDSTAYAGARRGPRHRLAREHEAARRDGSRPAADNPDRFRLFCPDETNSNRLGAVFEVEDRCLMDAGPDDEHVSPDGRVMEVLSEHLCQGWLEGYTLTGRHGLFATYEAFAMVSASMAIQHAKWLEGAERASVARAGPLAERAADLDLLAQRPQRLQPPGPRPDRHDDLAARQRRPRLSTADANTLLSVAEHCLASRDYVNLIVADKQDHLQYLDLERGARARRRGRLRLGLGGRPRTTSPIVVLASIGDVPTLEALAAAALLRERVPELALRFVNVVDLMRLPPPGDPPARPAPLRLRADCSDATITSWSPSTATPGHCTSSFTAARIRAGSTFTAFGSRGRRRHRST